MPEGKAHKLVKSKAAGKAGQTEVKISGGRRLDAATHKRAVEVETSGSRQRLEKAASRLESSGRSHHILVVPQKDMSRARQAMRTKGVSGTVRNITGTKRSTVRPAKSAKKTGTSKKK
ncbi:MAG: hypothetical protein IH957_09580 [Chloroflexi bacterium]|nr:hypothetical protein [Chloroflexota bacterium]